MRNCSAFKLSSSHGVLPCTVTHIHEAQKEGLGELRFPGKSDTEFRGRVERAACIARVLVEARLANREVQDMILDAADPHKEGRLQVAGTVHLWRV